jgi:spore germination cell wall hydrolase CwlJ-like protein
MLMRIVAFLGYVVICAAQPAYALDSDLYPFTSSHARVTIVMPELEQSDRKADFICMARNIYHEARGSSYNNQLAVALVTRNRMRNRGWTVCAVVMERRGGSAQFSWTAHRHTRWMERAAWDQAQQIASRVLLDDTLEDITLGATHFQENWSRPGWTRRARSAKRIGIHTFYRMEEVAEAPK